MTDSHGFDAYGSDWLGPATAVIACRAQGALDAALTGDEDAGINFAAVAARAPSVAGFRHEEQRLDAAAALGTSREAGAATVQFACL